MKRHPNKIAMLVLSCDKYSSLWPIYFNRLEKFWPDCEMKKYLLTNEKSYDFKGVITLKIGEDKSWSDNLIKALELVNEDTVLLMMEDAPLDGNVNNEKFKYLIHKYFMMKSLHLNLKSLPAPKQRGPIGIGNLPKNTLYRASVVPCVWDKGTLKELLRSGESAWEFEINGSKRSDNLDGFYSTNNPFFKILHIVIKGKVERTAWRNLKKNNEADFHDFKVMSRFEQAMLNLRNIRSIIFRIMIPARYQMKIRNFVL